MRLLRIHLLLIACALSQQVYTNTGDTVGTATGIHYSSGKIGIGTDNPLNILSINHSDPWIRLTDTNDAIGNLFDGGISMYDSAGVQAGWLGFGSSSDTDFYMNNNTGGRVRFRTYNTSTSTYAYMSFTDDGYLGIGDPSPEYPLDIENVSPTISITDLDGSGDSIRSIISFNDETGASKAFVGYNYYTNSKFSIANNLSNGILSFYTNSTERLVVNSNGKVGIGTDNPIANLQIGTMDLTGSQIGPSSSMWGYPTMLISYNDNYTNWDPPNPPAGKNMGLVIHNDDMTTGNHAAISFSTQTEYTGKPGIVGGMITTQFVYRQPGSSGNLNGELTFHTKYGGALKERMRLDYLGRLGIDTNSDPREKLDVRNGAGFFHTDGGDNQINLRLGAQVDDSLAALYDIYTNDSSGDRLEINSNRYTSELLLTHSTASGDVSVMKFVGASSNALSIFDTSGSTTQVFLRSSGSSYLNGGSIGIGTSSPSELLEVTSDSVDASILITASSGGSDASLKFETTNAGNANITYDRSAYDLVIENEKTGGTYGSIVFRTNSIERMEIDADGNFGFGSNFYVSNTGNVGIGTSDTHGAKLAVEGDVKFNGDLTVKMITVTDTVWADYVFADDYDLMSLEATEQFIKSNKHLPEMPSQAQISKEGRNLGDIQVKLLQKIEELTLHMIEMKKDNAEIRKENSALKARLEKLETRNGEN